MSCRHQMLSMEHEAHFTEQLGKQTQYGNEISPVYGNYKRIFLFKKFFEKCDLKISSRPFLIFKESSLKRNVRRSVY